MNPKNQIFFDEEAHAYYLEPEHQTRVPNYSSIISEVLGNKFNFVPEEVRQNALDRGTAVHKATENYDKGVTFETGHGVVGYLKQWKRALSDLGISGEFDLIEEPLFSKNHWYAITPDRINFKEQMCIEIKTGAKYDTHRLQTAAQSVAVYENFGVKIKRRLVVYLKENSYKIDLHTNDKDFYFWESINGFFHWKKFK